MGLVLYNDPGDGPRQTRALFVESGHSLPLGGSKTKTHAMTSKTTSSSPADIPRSRRNSRRSGTTASRHAPAPTPALVRQDAFCADRAAADEQLRRLGVVRDSDSQYTTSTSMSMLSSSQSQSQWSQFSWTDTTQGWTDATQGSASSIDSTADHRQDKSIAWG